MKTLAKRTVLALAIIVVLGAASQALAGNPGQIQGQYGGQFQGQFGGYPPAYTPTYNNNHNVNINQNINVNRNYNVNRTYGYRYYTPTYRVYRPRHTVCYW